MEVLKVSAKSQPKSVAGALSAVLRENVSAEVQAVGAGAVIIENIDSFSTAVGVPARVINVDYIKRENNNEEN